MRISTGLEATLMMQMGLYLMIAGIMKLKKIPPHRTELTLSLSLVDSCGYPHSHRVICSLPQFKCLKKEVPMLQMHFQASTRASSSARDFPRMLMAHAIPTCMAPTAVIFLFATVASSPAANQFFLKSRPCSQEREGSGDSGNSCAKDDYCTMLAVCSASPLSVHLVHEFKYLGEARTSFDVWSL